MFPKTEVRVDSSSRFTSASPAPQFQHTTKAEEIPANSMTPIGRDACLAMSSLTGCMLLLWANVITYLSSVGSQTGLPTLTERTRGHTLHLSAAYYSMIHKIHSKHCLIGFNQQLHH